MKKICTKCKENKDFSEFTKGNDEYGLRYQCKLCEKEYYKKNKERILEKQRVYYRNNSNRLSERNKLYYEENTEAVNKRNMEYRRKNKEKESKRGKLYRSNNKKMISKMAKQYRLNNMDDIKLKKKKYRAADAVYNPHYKNLTIDEGPRMHVNGTLLEVKCRYCNRYFVPTNLQVQNRVAALNGTTTGNQFLYCSDYCKQACPVFNQNKYPKGFKPSSSREVNPLVRQLCFERDNWTCQTCGATQETCHKEVHTLPGCNYYELRCGKE